LSEKTCFGIVQSEQKLCFVLGSQLFKVQDLVFLYQWRWEFIGKGRFLNYMKIFMLVLKMSEVNELEVGVFRWSGCFQMQKLV